MACGSEQVVMATDRADGLADDDVSCAPRATNAHIEVLDVAQSC
jgi:hypothetical protein